MSTNERVPRRRTLGARDIVNVSANDRCMRNAAMATLQRFQETDFYRLVTNEEFPGEYGERMAARRRGYKFERSLFRGNARRLRVVVGAHLGLNPESLTVRNFDEQTSSRAACLHSVRVVLSDIAKGRKDWDLLIHPKLQLVIPTTSYDLRPIVLHIEPDVLMWDPTIGMYVPIEIKSMVVRENVADAPDRGLARLQAAVQRAALQHELSRIGLAGRITDDAAFIFSTPYGLTPAPVFRDKLHAEIYQVERAMAAIARAVDLAARLPGGLDVPFHERVHELPFHYSETCVRRCILSAHCRKLLGSRAVVLGEDAAALLGREFNLDAIGAVLADGSGGTEHRHLAERLLDAGAALGLAPEELRRRLA